MTFRKFADLFPQDEKAPLKAECFHRVRLDEVDAFGVVCFSRYAGYFEQGRAQWAKKYGFDYQDRIANGFGMPIVQFYADYYHPLRSDENISIQTGCHWTEAAKMNFSYQICNENKQLAVWGYTIHAYTDLAGELMVVRPGFAEKFFQHWDHHVNN